MFAHKSDKTKAKIKIAPIQSLPSAKPSRRVFIEEEESAPRKVAANSMQVTISRQPSLKDRLGRKVDSDDVKTSSSVKQRLGAIVIDAEEGSERDVTAAKSSRSQRLEWSTRTASSSGSNKRVTIVRNSLDCPPPSKSASSLDSDVSSSRQKKTLDRKYSVPDEAKFEPDYDESRSSATRSESDSDSSSSDEQPTRRKRRRSSSSDERKSKKKKKKSKKKHKKQKKNKRK